MAKSKFCLVYTDFLLDDLCALEKLSEYYDGVFVYPYAPEKLGQPDNEYASMNITSLEDAISALKVWFGFAAEVGERGMEAIIPLVDDVFVLCPLTDVVRHLRKFPAMALHNFCLMAGSNEGVDYGDPWEWNQKKDPVSYNEFFSLVAASHVKQYTRNALMKVECAADTKMEFYDEYVACMKGVDETPYCPDLLSVQLYTSSRGNGYNSQHPLAQLNTQAEWAHRMSRMLSW